MIEEIIVKALLIIDVQKALFRKGSGIYAEVELIARLNLLIRNATKQKAPIFIIRHCNETFLKEGTADWQIHDGLRLPRKFIFMNKTHGSCFQRTGLCEELKRMDVKSVIIAGLVTQGCVRASSLDAMQLGFGVILVSDGHSTYSKDAANLISTWNESIVAAGATLRKAGEVSFD